MDQIDKAKPEKKSTKKLESISYEGCVSQKFWIFFLLKMKFF
jgi:hypothetical protein